MKLFSKKPQGAKEKFGVNVKIDKELDKYQGKNLFPKKLEEANKILSRISFK